MKEQLLCKYGEIVLKGANRRYFEDILCKTLRFRAKHYGKFNIYRSQSTIVIEPLNDDCDIQGMLDSAKKVFGIIGVSRCVICEKNLEDLQSLVKEYLTDILSSYKTFKVVAKRSDKAFPLTSMELMKEVGGYVLSSCHHLKVDVHNPEVIVNVEVRDYGICLHAGQEQGAGGLPVGSNGKCLLLLSGGIDSPVAGFMIAKRGVQVEAIHFESFPYTSERAKEKVLNLAKILTDYSGSMKVHVISLTHIQELLVKNCEEDYFTLMLRRYMMAIADKIAKNNKCGAIATGESLGQVASQTMEAIGVTNVMTSLPVFRPCIGMDKEEIIQISRKIGTYDTSIQPFEDCCTVFTPRHPMTHPKLEDVENQQKRLDFDALVEEAIQTEEIINIKIEF